MIDKAGYKFVPTLFVGLLFLMGIYPGLTLAQNVPLFGSSPTEKNDRDNGNLAICPHELLSKAYLGLADESPAVLDIYAVEQEVLLLCRERQELLLTIAKNDQLLREKLNIQPAGSLSVSTPPVVASVEPVECIPSEQQVMDRIETGQGTNSGDTDGENVSSLEQSSSQNEEMDTSDPASVDLSEQEGLHRCLPPLPYSLHSLMRVGSHWQARLRTAEDRTIDVKLRDSLPDGRIVTDISGRGIEISDFWGNSERLPLQARPSSTLDEPDGKGTDQSTQPSTDPGISDMTAEGTGQEIVPDMMSGNGTRDVILPSQNDGKDR